MNDRTIHIGDTAYRLPKGFVQPPLPFDPVKQAEINAKNEEYLKWFLGQHNCMKHKPPYGAATQFTCPECGKSYRLESTLPTATWDEC